jgi:hypothetical protein
LSLENPEALGARILYFIGEAAARELLGALSQEPEERAALIGRLYGRKEARWLAELMIDIEEDPMISFDSGSSTHYVAGSRPVLRLPERAARDSPASPLVLR